MSTKKKVKAKKPIATKKTVPKSRKNKKPVVVTMQNIHSLQKLPEGTIIHAYKYTDMEYAPPYKWHMTSVKYLPGYVYTEDDYDTDTYLSCGAGLNIATKQWCESDGWKGCKLLLVALKVEDIVCVPTRTDGKFRCKRFEVLKEIKTLTK